MKVSELTIEELQTLIKKALHEELHQLLSDPDQGLELRPELETRLRASLASKKRFSFEAVKKKANLI